VPSGGGYTRDGSCVNVMVANGTAGPYKPRPDGEVAERLKVAVSKTVVA